MTLCTTTNADATNEGHLYAEIHEQKEKLPNTEIPVSQVMTIITLYTSYNLYGVNNFINSITISIVECCLFGPETHQWSGSDKNLIICFFNLLL